MPMIWVFIFVAIAKPAASSEAELILEPVLRRSIDVLMSALLSAIAAAERMALRLVREIIYSRPQLNAVGEMRSKIHAFLLKHCFLA